MKSVIINRKNKISNRKLEKMKPVGTRLFQDLMEHQFLLVRNYMYSGSMRIVLGVKKQKAGSFSTHQNYSQSYLGETSYKN